MCGFRFSPNSVLLPLILTPLDPLDLYFIPLLQDSLPCLKISVQHFRCPVYDYEFTEVRTPLESEHWRVFPNK